MSNVSSLVEINQQQAKVIESQAREIEELKAHQCQPVCVFNPLDEIKELRAALVECQEAIEFCVEEMNLRLDDFDNSGDTRQVIEALTRCKEVLND